MRIAWTRDELIAVLKLYCRTPFGRLHSRNPEIIQLASEIGRSPGAVALKAVNFASLDPTIERKGMSNASTLDRKVWNDFFGNMETFLAQSEPTYKERGLRDRQPEEYDPTFPDGVDVHRISKTRQNQSFFREMVLASYDCKCAISGIQETALLTASHIVPWSADPTTRINPRNGICLNALHDRAFDRGLISFGDDLELIYSPALRGEVREKIESLGGNKLNPPSRFRPEPRFLEYHRTNVFRTS